MRRVLFENMVPWVFSEELSSICKLLKVHIVYVSHPDASSLMRPYFVLSKNHYTSHGQEKEFFYKYTIRNTDVATVYTNNWMSPYLTLPKKCIRLLIGYQIEEETYAKRNINLEHHNSELTLISTFSIEWNMHVALHKNRLKIENICSNIFSVFDLYEYLKEL